MAKGAVPIEGIDHGVETPLHRGSFSHPLGTPMAAMSMEGEALNNALTLVRMSLLGEMTFRKYLMMHRLK